MSKNRKQIPLTLASRGLFLFTGLIHILEGP